MKSVFNLAEKLAEFAGFTSDTVDSSAAVIEEIEKQISDAKSFSDFLNYKYFDDDLFFGDDGSVSFLLKLNPLVGCDENHTKNLELFFNDELPPHSWIQFILIASNDIEPVLNVWRDGRISNIAALKNMEETRAKFLTKAANDYKEFSGRNARNFKLFISFTQKDPDIKRLKVFMQTLKHKLETLDLAPNVLVVEDLILLVREILEIDLSSKARSRSAHYNKNILISDQILTPGYRHDLKEDRVEHRSTGLASRLYFVSDLPKEFSLNEMISLLGDSSRSHLSVPGRFIISYTIASNLNKAAQGAVVSKGDRVIASAEQWYSRNNRNLIRESAEWKDIIDRAKNGERFLNEFFSVMVTTQREFLNEAEQNLYSLYNLLGWRLDVNRYFQFPALLSILPFHVHKLWTYFSGYKLSRTALSSEIIAKLPIHAEWRGVPEPGMLLLGRRGQLFHWNPFYRISSGNYNVCVFGPPGSGKSVFLQELTTCMMAQNCKVFILDIGQSYKNICELLGGEVIQFGKNSNLSLNPFAGFKDEMNADDRLEAISYAKAIICSMCGSKGDNLKESIIEKSVKKGLEKYGQNFDITRLAKVFIEIGKEEGSNIDIAQDLSLSLYPYTEDGMFGKFFGGGNSNTVQETKFDKQITVFEFEEIRNNTSLLAVVLQIIGMQIFMQVLTGDRSKRFVLIVDEAWMILDYAAKFLAELARTIRKYGGSLVVCVQNFNDMQGGDQQRSILENSSWTVLLKQDEKGLNAFKHSEAFKDIVPLIKSVSIAREKYAEMLICATGVKVVGRLMLDNYSKILYSTDADVFNALGSLRKEGIPIDEAVSIVAKRRYGDN